MQTIIKTNNFVIQKMNTTYLLQEEDNDTKVIKPAYFLSKEIEIKKSSYLKIKHQLQYQCTSCSKAVKKIYSGFCYNCLYSKAEADLCIMSPNRCHYIKGTCRSKEFAETFCYQTHYLYLSFTDKYKVGLTRYTQIPTRWIDQGATLASPMLKTYSRHQAGVIEKFLSQHMSDKSHWQNMLKMQNRHPSIEEFKEKIVSVKTWILEHDFWRKQEWSVPAPDHLSLEKETNFLPNIEVYKIIYPIYQDFSEKIHSVKLETLNMIEGFVTGIKGQYIMLDNNRVLNLRNHSGFVVDLEVIDN